MPMTREDHKTTIEAIMALVGAENQARASELLTSISDGFEEVVTSLESAQGEVTKLTERNETLREVNTKLFLRTGEVPKGNPNKDEHKEDQPPKMEFTDLFDDKGGLK